MKRSSPEIRIKNGRLIYQNISIHLHKLWGKKKKLASIKEIDKKVLAYQKAWDKYEKSILQGMYEITGLEFKQNIIDVYIAPWMKAFSDPMIIGIKYEPDYFVDILTHELLHRLLTDNVKIGKVNLIAKWKNFFGKNHSFGTLTHIPVHAIHKSIFLDILNQPKRLEREIARMKEYKATDYINSWNYVDKNDYKRIVKLIVAIYK
jgi:hypothetical protein